MNGLQAAAGTVARVWIGGTMFAHGAQKLFAWYGGHGLQGTGDFFHSVGFRPGRQHALASGLSEAGGGALLAAGLATPAAGAAISSSMLVAGTTHSGQGFFNADGGYELPALIAVLAGSYAASGPGPISLDHALGHALDRPWMRIAALAAIVPAALVVTRRRSAALAADASSAASTSSTTGAA